MKKLITILLLIAIVAFVIGCLASSNPFEGNMISNLWDAVSNFFVSLG